MTTANKLLYQMCEGCNTYGYIVILKPGLEVYHRGCQIEYPVLSDCQCPCINCIIKGICDNSCEALIEFDFKHKQEESAKAHKHKVTICGIRL